MSTEIKMPSNIFPEFIVLLTTLVVATAAIMPGIDRKIRRYFIAFFSLNALSGIFFILDVITYMNPKTIAFSTWLPLIEYLLFSLPAMILNFYLMECCEENWRKSVLFMPVILLWVIFCLSAIIGHVTEFFYYSTPEGRFFRKPTHPLLYLPLVLILAIDIITLIFKRKRFSLRHFLALLIYLIPAMIATIIQAITFDIVALNTTLSISSIAVYMIILTDQIEQYMRQQAAIANQNANIMVLKMRPHFIYNTMTSIYYLCEQDPKKAQQVILDFTSYLRKNFNAMVSNDMIYFSEELEHIQAYLAVELSQFEDNLSVEYDTPHTQFRLPPLTLQPLVENAIKHGMNPDSEPLRIIVKTASTNSGSLIIVKDNGPGFDPKDVFDSHNALSNIKKRLEIMCRGKITIISEKDEGTEVRILIPSQ